MVTEFADLLKYIYIFSKVKNCENDAKERYDKLPIFEKLSYTAPYICAYIALEDEEYLELVTRRLKSTDREDVKNLRNKFLEEISELGLTSQNPFIDFQILSLYLLLADILYTYQQCVGSDGCIERNVINKVLHSVEHLREKPYEAFHGLHVLSYLNLLTRYRRDGRESVVFRSLRLASSSGIDKGVVESFVAEVKRYYGDSWRNRISEWHKWFLTILGGMSLTTTWDFTHLNSELVKWLFGELKEEELDRELDLFHRSATTRRPGIQIEVMHTALGKVVTLYTTHINFSAFDKNKLDEDIKKLENIFFRYLSSLLDIYYEGKNSSDKAIPITDSAKRLRNTLVSTVKESSIIKRSDIDIDGFISYQDVEWDLIIFLMRRSGKKSFVHFWLRYPQDDTWIFE